MIPEEEEDENDLPAPDSEKIKEFMFEAISAMGPRLFRPNQEAHAAHGIVQEETSLRPLVAITASAFATGVAIGAIWERRRHG